MFSGSSALVRQSKKKRTPDGFQKAKNDLRKKSAADQDDQQHDNPRDVVSERLWLLRLHVALSVPALQRFELRDCHWTVFLTNAAMISRDRSTALTSSKSMSVNICGVPLIRE